MSEIIKLPLRDSHNYSKFISVTRNNTTTKQTYSYEDHQKRRPQRQSRNAPYHRSRFLHRSRRHLRCYDLPFLSDVPPLFRFVCFLFIVTTVCFQRAADPRWIAALLLFIGQGR